MVLTKFREDRLKNATVGMPTDTYIHTYRHTKTDLIICPMLWYSNGTDNNNNECNVYGAVIVTQSL